MSFKDVAVSDTPTHILIYRDSFASAHISGVGSASSASPSNSDVNNKIDELSKKLEQMMLRIKELEENLDGRVIKTTPFFGSSIAPEPAGLMVRRLSDVETDTKTTFQTIIHKLNSSGMPQVLEEKGQLSEIDDVKEEIEEIEEEQEEAAEEEEAEEEEEAAEEEEEEAEEVVEYTEFEYKGVTYYKDSENMVYRVEEDGDLDETPIGVWNEEKQKVLRYKQ